MAVWWSRPTISLLFSLHSVCVSACVCVCVCVCARACTCDDNETKRKLEKDILHSLIKMCGGFFLMINIVIFLKRKLNIS